MRKITVEIVVDADQDHEVFDGLNDTFGEEATRHGFIIDWMYPNQPSEAIAGTAESYQEGDAWA